MSKAEEQQAWSEFHRLHAELHSLDMTLRYGDWRRCPACKSLRDNALNVNDRKREQATQ